MLINIQAHYLDLIVTAVEEAGHGLLHYAETEARGNIYITATQKPGDTKAMAVMHYSFDEQGAKFAVQLHDGRKIAESCSYIEGLDVFFKKLTALLTGNRLENKEGKEAPALA